MRVRGPRSGKWGRQKVVGALKPADQTQRAPGRTTRCVCAGHPTDRGGVGPGAPGAKHTTMALSIITGTALAVEQTRYFSSPCSTGTGSTRTRRLTSHDAGTMATLGREWRITKTGSPLERMQRANMEKWLPAWVMDTEVIGRLHRRLVCYLRGSPRFFRRRHCQLSRPGGVPRAHVESLKANSAHGSRLRSVLSIMVPKPNVVLPEAR